MNESTPLEATVEITCTGGNGRSHMLVAMLQDLAYKGRLEGNPDMQFVASGTWADDTDDSTWTPERLEKLFKYGIQAGLRDWFLMPVPEYFRNSESRPKAISVGRCIRNSLHEREAAERVTVLGSLGLAQYDSSGRLQFPATQPSRTHIFLGVQDYHVDEMQKILSGRNGDARKARVDCISNYSGVELIAANPLGNLKSETYIEYARRAQPVAQATYQRLCKELTSRTS